MKKFSDYPIRKCVACHARRKKSEFFRVAKLKNNSDKKNFEIFVDKTLKSPGRGAYICKSVECLNLARKKRSFSKALRGKVDDEIYESIEKMLVGKMINTDNTVDDLQF